MVAPAQEAPNRGRSFSSTSETPSAFNPVMQLPLPVALRSKTQAEVGRVEEECWI